MRCLLIGASQDLMKVNLLKVERERRVGFWSYGPSVEVHLFPQDS